MIVQIDSTAQALKWITIAGAEPQALTYMYMQLAEIRNITIDEAREHIKKPIEDGWRRWPSLIE